MPLYLLLLMASKKWAKLRACINNRTKRWKPTSFNFFFFTLGHSPVTTVPSTLIFQFVGICKLWLIAICKKHRNKSANTEKCNRDKGMLWNLNTQVLYSWQTTFYVFFIRSHAASPSWLFFFFFLFYIFGEKMQWFSVGLFHCL